MKTLKLLFGMAIATTLLFTACDKTDDAQCATEQYKKDIAGEWVCYYPDYVEGGGINFHQNALMSYGSYITIKENGYFTWCQPVGFNSLGNIYDTLNISASTEWENYNSWSITDNKFTIDYQNIGVFVYTYKIEYINEDEMALTLIYDGNEAGTQNFRRITEEDMVYVWTE
jgi:hypothetical protein